MDKEMTALWDYLIETGAATEAELSLMQYPRKGSTLSHHIIRNTNGHTN
jgi:hypothetical protein